MPKINLKHTILFHFEQTWSILIPSNISKTVKCIPTEQHACALCKDQSNKKTYCDVPCKSKYRLHGCISHRQK